MPHRATYAVGVDSAGVTRTGWLRSTRYEQFILSGLAIVIGIAVAYGAIGFREFIGLVHLAFYAFSSENVATLARELAWWHVLLAPVPGSRPSWWPPTRPSNTCSRSST